MGEDDLGVSGSANARARVDAQRLPSARGGRTKRKKGSPVGTPLSGELPKRAAASGSCERFRSTTVHRVPENEHGVRAALGMLAQPGLSNRLAEERENMTR